MRFAFLVVAYNRLPSVVRLVSSLERVEVGNDKVDLIVSIDYSGMTAIEDFFKHYHWGKGKLVLRAFNERQGLKKHILSCGDYFGCYDAIAIFEDDIVVSPSAFHFMKEAASFFYDDMSVGGISLYSPRINFNVLWPFEPAKGNSDVFFLQYAQSWGQIWMKKQWGAFRAWLSKAAIVFDDTTPDHVNGWPDRSSWLKLHTKYLVDNNISYVYPYVSFTTCFSEIGEHTKGKTEYTQTPLVEGQSLTSFRFERLSSQSINYDVFYERIIPGEPDMLVDIYGSKTKLYGGAKKILSTNYLNFRIVKSFALRMHPQELNYLLDVSGNEIFLFDASVRKKNPRIDVDFNRYSFYTCLSQRKRFVLKMVPKIIANSLFKGKTPK